MWVDSWVREHIATRLIELAEGVGEGTHVCCVKRDRSEHEQSESSLRAETSKIARLSEGKPQDLQRKGRTITASHGTLAVSINSRHELLYCDVVCLGVCRMSWGGQ